MINTDYLERCLLTLERAIDGINSCEAGTIDYEMYRNATIKGFELTLETSGKLLRKAIKPYFSGSKKVDQLVFKDIFRYAAKHGLLTIAEVERWHCYRDNRNTTVHDYGEEFAEETLKLMPGFVNDVRSLIASIQHVQSESKT